MTAAEALRGSKANERPFVDDLIVQAIEDGLDYVVLFDRRLSPECITSLVVDGYDVDVSRIDSTYPLKTRISWDKPMEGV